MVGELIMVEAIKKDLEDQIEFYKMLMFDMDNAKRNAVADLRDAFDRLPTNISIKLLKALKEAEELA